MYKPPKKQIIAHELLEILKDDRNKFYFMPPKVLHKIIK